MQLPVLIGSLSRQQEQKQETQTSNCDLEAMLVDEAGEQARKEKKKGKEGASVPLCLSLPKIPSFSSNQKPCLSKLSWDSV